MSKENILVSPGHQGPEVITLARSYNTNILAAHSHFGHQMDKETINMKWKMLSQEMCLSPSPVLHVFTEVSKWNAPWRNNDFPEGVTSKLRVDRDSLRVWEKISAYLRKVSGPEILNGELQSGMGSLHFLQAPPCDSDLSSSFADTAGVQGHFQWRLGHQHFNWYSFYC